MSTHNLTVHPVLHQKLKKYSFYKIIFAGLTAEPTDELGTPSASCCFMINNKLYLIQKPIYNKIKDIILTEGKLLDQ